jgi:hypothetical protein
MTTDNTNNPTEELKTGPIENSEVDAWEQALSDQDKIQLRRLQLQQASINRAAAQDKEPDWSRLPDNEFLKERMRRYGF